MYDSYSDYYGFNDVEVPEVKTIGSDIPQESYSPKPYYTINFEPIPMTIQQERILYSHVTKLKQQVSQHIRCLTTFEPTEEIEFVLSECFDILDTEIVSFEHYEFINWYFNHGQLRSEDEMNNHIYGLLQARKQVEDEQASQVSSGIATFFFAIFMFFVIFISPGLIFSGGGFEALLSNLLLLVIAAPIQLFLWGISIVIFSKAIGSKSGPSVKGVVATTAISAAMHTRTMSKMGKTLFSKK